MTDSSVTRAVAREIAETARLTRAASGSESRPNRQSGSIGGIHTAHDTAQLPGISKCIQALRELRDRTEKTRSEIGERPAPDSRAAAEYALCQEPEMLRTAYSQGAHLLFLGSADHLCGLERALTHHSLSCTPFTCARAVLEACATGLWLLDLKIDMKGRMARSLNYRLESIRSQDRLRKKIELRGDKAGREWLSENPAAATAQRIEHLRDIARRFGIPSRSNKSGRFLGFGTGMPKISERIGCAFGSEADYSILSLVAHSDQTGLTQLGARTVRTRDGAVSVPELGPWHAAWLSCDAVQWHSKAVWAHFRLLGRGLEETREAFEDAYELLGLKRALWFWRPSNGRTG